MARSIRVTIYATPAEHEAWTTSADEVGLDLGNWIRSTLKTSSKTIQAEKTKSTPKLPKPTKEELKKQNAEKLIRSLTEDYPPFPSGTPRGHGVIFYAENRDDAAWSANDETAHKLYLLGVRYRLEHDIDPNTERWRQQDPYYRYMDACGWLAWREKPGCENDYPTAETELRSVLAEWLPDEPGLADRVLLDKPWKT